MKSPKLHLLSDPVFLLGLALLLLNDFVLKYEASGWVTGKLSDVSGLFIFPFFFSVFFARLRILVYVLTGILFSWWKLPVATDAIHTINQWLGTNFSRVVDYSDLIALAVLPVSYARFNKQYAGDYPESKNFVAPMIISIISISAFVATTVPNHVARYPLAIQDTLLCNRSKEDIFTKYIITHGRLADNLRDSVFDVTHQISIAYAQITTRVKIFPRDETHTVFVLDSVLQYTVPGRLFFDGHERKSESKIKSLSRNDFIADFKNNVIKVIEAGDTTSIIWVYNVKGDSVRFRGY